MAITEGSKGHLAEHEDIRVKLAQTLDSTDLENVLVAERAEQSATFVTVDAEGNLSRDGEVIPIEGGSLTQIESVRAEAFRRAFAEPLQQDMPVITVLPTTSAVLRPLGNGFLIKRVGDVASGAADLAGDTHFLFDGTPSMAAVAADPTVFVQAPLLPGGTVQAAPYTFSLETLTESANKEIEFMVRAPGTSFYYRVYVDGRMTAIPCRNATGLTSGSWYVIRLVFPVARSRSIRIEHVTNGLGVGAAYLPTGQTIVRPALTSIRRVAIIGDSYEGGSGVAPAGGLRNETGAFLAARMLGADSVWQFGIGGTGYVTSPDSNAFGTRAAAVLACAPQTVIISGSVNDGQADTAGIRAAVTSLLNALASVPEVYVTGPSRSAAFAGNNLAIKEATLAAGRRFIDPLDPLWLTTAMIGTDTIHPTFAGHKRRASRLHEEISALRAP